jgi:hypothetical protein
MEEFEEAQDTHSVVDYDKWRYLSNEVEEAEKKEQAAKKLQEAVEFVKYSHEEVSAPASIRFFLELV